jgi:AraC-like DNA-binding protein
MPTSAGRGLRFVLSQLEAAGYGVDRILKQAGIPKGVADNPEARLSRAQVWGFWDAAVAVTGDPFLGLHTGTMVRPAGLDALGYVFWSSASLGDGLSRLARYHRFIDDALMIAVEIHGRRARVVVTSAMSEVLPRPISEFLLAYLLQGARSETGDPHLDPSEVEFAFRKPAKVAPYRKVFRAPVRFSRASNVLVFPLTVLYRPFLHHEPDLREVLERRVQDLIARLPSLDSAAVDARALIGQQLPGGPPSAKVVARDLGLSERTLHRRLRGLGTSFRRVTAQIRHEQAERHIRAGVPFTDVAFLLGYSEASSFHRAFRRWTGLTPQAYRRDAAAEPDPGEAGRPPR